MEQEFGELKHRMEGEMKEMAEECERW